MFISWPRNWVLAKKKRNLTGSGTTQQICVDRQFREDLRFWIETDRKLAIRLLTIVDDVERSPFKGIGKPEPLKHIGADLWSRRLNQEHRVVYLVEHERIVFISARYHY